MLNPNNKVIYVVDAMRMNYEVLYILSVFIESLFALNHSSTLFSSSHTFSHKAFKSL